MSQVGIMYASPRFSLRACLHIWLVPDALPVCLAVSLSVRLPSVMATVYLSWHSVLCAIHGPSQVVTLEQTGLLKTLGSSALLVWQHLDGPVATP